MEHAQDGIHGRSDFMAHVGHKLPLALAGLLRLVPRFLQRLCIGGRFGHIDIGPENADGFAGRIKADTPVALQVANATIAPNDAELTVEVVAGCQRNLKRLFGSRSVLWMQVPSPQVIGRCFIVGFQAVEPVALRVPEQGARYQVQIPDPNARTLGGNPHALLCAE